MLNPSAVLYGPHDVRIEDRPVPKPAAGQVLVEIAAIGICGSDVHYYEHGRIGDYVVDDPMIIGHESAGTVVDVGDGVDRNRVGELVALEPGVPCRTCTQCLQGRYNLCRRVVFFATPPVDGSISRYVAIDAAFAHPAPSGLTAEQAAMAEPVSVGIWAARKSAVTGGDRVLITGAGPIGLLAGQVARALGAETPVITDVSDFRLARARDLGLRTAQARTPLEEEFDVLLECSGAPAALTGGMRALAPAGRGRLGGDGRRHRDFGRGPRAGRRALRDRRVPLRQHLSAGPPADQQRRDQRHRRHHPPLRSRRDRTCVDDQSNRPQLPESYGPHRSPQPGGGDGVTHRRSGTKRP
jgi:L-iditol 2-dehydrogenase